MYVTHLKALVVKALNDTFDSNHPVAQMRNLQVSLNYPVREVDFPSIWVDWEPSTDLQRAGVAHVEYVETEGGFLPVYRWRYQGYVAFTIVAMSSLERDLIFDELITIMAFGTNAPNRSKFRELIETNDLIAANFDFDEIGQRGFSAAPGTPWNSDDWVYEATVAMECIGEFVLEPTAPVLVPLSQVVLWPYTQPPGDPVPEGVWE